MTNTNTRHNLSETLADEGFSTWSPLCFLRLLAGWMASTDGELRANAEVLLNQEQPELEYFREWLDLTASIQVPTNSDGLSGWIQDVEILGLAFEAAKILPVREDLLIAMKEKVLQISSAFSGTTRPWDCWIVGESLGSSSLMPWTWVRSRVRQGLLRVDLFDENVLNAWYEGVLHPEDAAALYEWVRMETIWQLEYRKSVQKYGADIYVRTYDPELTTSVAGSDEEEGECVLYLTLPHLGRKVALQGHLHREGVRWSYEGIARPVEISSGAAYEWGDEAVGRITTKTRTQEMTVEERLRNVAWSLVDVAWGGGVHPRAKAIALAGARSLKEGDFFKVLREGCMAFDEGKDLDDNQVGTALQARLALDRIAHRLCDEDLDAALEEADVATEPFKSALLLLETRVYEDIIRDYFVDSCCWYGYPLLLEEQCPSWVLEQALENQGAS